MEWGIELGSLEPEDDKPAFKAQVYECLDDRRVKGYFRLDLFARDDVVNSILDDAYEQATQRDSYRAFTAARAKLQGIVDRNHVLLSDGTVNLRTVIALPGTAVLVIFLAVAVLLSDIPTWFVTAGAAALMGLAAWGFAAAMTRRVSRFQGYTLSFVCGSAAVCAIVLPWILAGVVWKPSILFPALILACAVGCTLYDRQTFGECRRILAVLNEDKDFYSLRTAATDRKRKWLRDCREDVIHTQAVFAINTMLGRDKDRFLVEQDSEGLRKLRDLNFTISTRTERKIISVLAQMDGGSIALAGPRGAGKSTLLRKLSGTLLFVTNKQPGIHVYVSAPAEYIPRDFIAEVLQRLCEEYLASVRGLFPEPIYNYRSRFSPRRALWRMGGIVGLLLRSIILIAIVVGVIWPVLRVIIHAHYHFHAIYISAFNGLRHWYDGTYYHALKLLHEHIKTHRSWVMLEVIPRIFLLLVAIGFLYPSSWMWKRYILPHREPTLARQARDYLFRLQVDKTITWGNGLNLPLMRGGGLSLNKGGSASYTPWTLPELVRHTRSFMLALSREFNSSSHAVVIGIDEIDRIGSLDHAERFIGEVKAIFGIERCFFVVAVAEDVGSIFAQRATVGRSILENAFDDIIVVDPLNFLETRDLLLKRVPGFTDSFVYLVHALSGGLPRELIRVTRRLVEINQEMRYSGRKDGNRPRLENLAFALVQESIIEAIRATRNQLARLALPDGFTVLFDKLHSASAVLTNASPFFMSVSYSIIVELGEMKIPDHSTTARGKSSAVNDDLERARRIVRDFSAFSYFGVAVIEAFSDEYFDLELVQDMVARGSEGSYDQLAVARTELTVSPDNSREMIRRFRDSLRSHTQLRHQP